MHVEPTPRFIVEEWMESASIAQLPTHSHNCPHCGLQVRYPTVAREHDIRDFAELMEQYRIVLERHGYLGKLLSEVQAQCHIAIAMKKGQQ